MNRNRTGDLWRRAGLVLLIGCVVATTAAIAQDSDSDGSPKAAERTNRVRVDFGSWVAQPAGLEYAPVSRLNPNNDFGAEQLSLRQATEGEMRWRVMFRMPERHAGFSVSYYSHRTGSSGADATPGQFIFGERLAAPAFAGYALDGLADAWDSSNETRLRDARIQYHQRLFATDDGIEMTGAIGWGRVWHTRTQAATYYALLPDIPPLLPPLDNPDPTLVPDPDTASLGSRFEGRGLTAELQLIVPLLGDRLQLEASADLAVLRGEIDASYASLTNAYVIDDTTFLEPPYDIFGESVEIPIGSGVFIPTANRIDQLSFGTGQRLDQTPTSGDVQGLSLGLRWRSLDWLDVYGGFRSTRYSNVGLDVLPGPLSSVVNGAQDFRRETRSAKYEGFYVGVTFFVF